MRTVAFYTLGCKVNQYETEAISEMFKNKGYKVIDPNKKADLYVINTCSVTNLGERKSRQFIRRSKKKNNEAIVCVVGCYAQLSPEEVMDIEGVDLILGTKDRNNIVDLCEEAIRENKKINAVEDIMQTKEFEEMTTNSIQESTRAYIKIQEGCNQYCSYCIIPYARGPIRSRKLENILSETQAIVKKGFKEIVLTGIHVASYGKDIGDIRLIDVIEKVHEIEGLERIRLSSLEPTLITEEFMERLSSLEKVCPHFHLSLQSGSDSVLNRMNRKYTTKDYKERVDLIRKYMKDVAITTDIIVGFPGETEQEFEETYNFVKKIGFAKVHVFKYSPRKGTPAAKYKNQVHGTIKKNRSNKLIKLVDSLAKEFVKEFIGREMKVLIEAPSHSDGYMEGYAENYIRVMVKGNEELEENIINVIIKDSYEEKLIGKKLIK